MKTSPRSPSTSSKGKTNGNGFHQAKGGTKNDASTSKPSKKERNALIQRYMTIDWSSITADHPYILALANLRLAPTLTLPSDKSTVLTMAFSSFGPMILNFVLLSIKIEPTDFPRSKKSKIALVVATIINKNNLLKSDMTVNVNKVKGIGLGNDSVVTTSPGNISGGQENLSTTPGTINGGQEHLSTFHKSDADVMEFNL